MGSEQQFCLRWNNHNANMMTVFDHLLQSESLVDVTLSCEGCSLRAHKVVLSACSPYFQAIFTENPCKHPVVILKEVNISELRALIDFMYKGEVNVSQEHLTSLLKTAEYLKIKGLSEVTQGRSGVTGSRETIVETHRADVDMVVAVDRHPPISGFGPLSPGGKRKRMRHRTSDSVSSGSPNGTRSENDCSSSLVLDMKGSPEVLESQVDLPHHGGIVDVGGMTDHYLDHDHQRMDDEDDVDVEVDRNDGDNQSPTGDDRRCQPRSPLDSKEKIVTLPPPPPLVDQNDIIPPRLPVLELAPPPYAHHHHHHQQLHHRHPPSPTQNLLLVPPTSTSGVAVPSTSAAHVQHAQDPDTTTTLCTTSCPSSLNPVVDIVQDTLVQAEPGIQQPLPPRLQQQESQESTSEAGANVHDSQWVPDNDDKKTWVILDCPKRQQPQVDDPAPAFTVYPTSVSWSRTSTSTTKKEWTEETIGRALDAVRSGRLSINRASTTFGIPNTTLWQRSRKEGIDTSRKALSSGHPATHWTEEHLTLALDAVREGRMSLNRASTEFGIPATTLWTRARRRGIVTARWRSGSNGSWDGIGNGGGVCSERDENMYRAMELVRAGQASVSQASLQFNVPYTTLWNRLRK